MAGKIFISYRREENAANALSIGQYLEHEFGRNNVFIDVDMRAGARFPAVLEERLRSCKVMLALIGKNWLSIKDDEGEQRRIDNPEDWVRLEVARALTRGITVIPVRVDGAALPKKAMLPEDIQGLLDHQAATVTTTSFRNDMAGLVRDIHKIPNPTKIRNVGIGAGVAVVILLLTSIVLYQTRLLTWAQPYLDKIASSFQNQSEEIVPVGPEWTLYGLSPTGFAQYLKLNSVKEFPGRVSAKVKIFLDPNLPNYSGKTDKEAVYEDDINVYDCNSAHWVAAETTIYDSSGGVRFHYKWGDPEWVEFSLGSPINPGSIPESGQTILCNKDMRTPLVSKSELAEMKFSDLSSNTTGDGEIYYKTNKSFGGKDINLLITKYNSDKSTSESVKTNTAGTPHPYRTVIQIVDVNCAEPKLTVPKVEFYDSNNNLVFINAPKAPEPVNVSENSPFARLRKIACATTQPIHPDTPG